VTVLNLPRYSSDLDRDDQIDVQLVLGQRGWQFVGSLPHAVAGRRCRTRCPGGSDLACGGFRVEPPFFGAAPHVETC
jgi:hypothetical protein